MCHHWVHQPGASLKYVSTRGDAPAVSFIEATVAGLAPDGGLYVPDTIPRLPSEWREWDYRTAVASTLQLFGAADIESIVDEAAARFADPVVAPIREVGDRQVLELFHGPTLSFKDHALQVVARLLSREVERGVVLGATSGDTGSAAIEACRGMGNLEVVILFPDGRVSDFQRRQMTTVPDRNAHAVAVRGTFDDCQRLVKESLARSDHLLAVNSINWARIAVQAGYHIYAAGRLDQPTDFVVPTGNFGNVFACYLAKKMGASIGSIVIANNANHGLSDLVNTGELRPGVVIPTLAPAMDVQIPSNLERFVDDPSEEFLASWSDDRQIAHTMARVYERIGYRIDPHTATAWHAAEEHRGDNPQLVVSTAHPVKFDAEVPAPGWFGDLSGLSERFETIEPDVAELARFLR